MAVGKSLDINQEVTSDHTRLLRVSLSPEDNRAYWENYQSGIKLKNLATVAFEERWFGSKSMNRIKDLLNDFRYRFVRFPSALNVLCAWRPNDPFDRQNIAHWHLQLADPLYRDFTGSFLLSRRNLTRPRIDMAGTVRWITDRVGDRWAVSTKNKIAMNLVTSAADAGLCSNNPGIRNLSFPKVSDISLAYILYLLRECTFEGTLLDNPYLASVGLTGSFIEKRVRKLPGLSYSRMVNVQNFHWLHPDLKTWAKDVLSISSEEVCS